MEGKPDGEWFEVDGTCVQIEDFKGEKLAPFNPSSDEVIQMALELLQVTELDFVYDLGCGDGRMLVEAITKSGAQGVGIEYDRKYAERAKQRMKDAGVADKVTILHSNVLDVDLGNATAVFVYLCPVALKTLRGALISLLRRGARIVSYMFSVPGLIPTAVKEFKSTRVMFYTIGSLGPSAEDGKGG